MTAVGDIKHIRHTLKSSIDEPLDRVSNEVYMSPRVTKEAAETSTTVSSTPRMTNALAEASKTAAETLKAIIVAFQPRGHY